MTEKLLSKSRYVKGCQCPKLLWLSANEPDLATPPTPEDEQRFENGDRVGELATKRYPGGVLIDTQPWEYERSIALTEVAVTDGAPSIYEASAQTAEGAYARADILLRIGGECWDIIEVKSSTDRDTKRNIETYLPDLALQYHVFENAGYRIGRCILLLMNSAYRRDGELDLQELFVEYDITDQVESMQSQVVANIGRFKDIMRASNAPSQEIGPHCSKPHDCAFKAHCWEKVPEYSVFNLFQVAKAVEIAEASGSYEVRDIPMQMVPKGNKYTDYAAFMEQRMLLQNEHLKQFLAGLQFPLYFLDYESLNPAVPLYDGTKPYQQVPFQFSLHMYNAPDAEGTHQEYIHKAQTDPREELVKALVEACGDSGSVVVYYAPYERTRNIELAEAFPQYAEQLHAINARMVDLCEPFSKRWIYHPDQMGSASIKKVLPTYTDLSYQGMEIANGAAAASRYLEFAENGLEQEAQERLWRALSFYCRMDTYAMVRVLQELQSYVRA